MAQKHEEVKPMAYDLADTTKILGCSDGKLRSELQVGNIKGFQIGTAWHFSARAIEDYIAQQEKKAALKLHGAGGPTLAQKMDAIIAGSRA